MKKRVFLIWSILAIAVIPLFISCKNDKEMTEDDYPFYADMGEDEQVVLELKDEPAYVYDYYRQYVFICYSKYADEYYLSPNINDLPQEVIEDVHAHRIGVLASNFYKYNLPLNSKVYISVSVTNNGHILKIPGDIDPEIDQSHLSAKAYLKDLRLRN
ncbi:hypothetical protein [Parabacteroides sp.]